VANDPNGVLVSPLGYLLVACWSREVKGVEFVAHTYRLCTYTLESKARRIDAARLYSASKAASELS